MNWLEHLLLTTKLVYAVSPVVIRVPESRCTHGRAHRLFDWMRDPPGTVEVS